MFNYKYLSKQHLKGLNGYKYNVTDASLIGNYLMQPIWNILLNFTPKSIAPNLITLIGFLCVLAMDLLMSLYDYDLCAVSGKPGEVAERNHNYGIPNWVFTICGILVFLTYNLDAIDGKQARRLGVSGPLGELFDHGLDSNVVYLIPLCMISIFGRDTEYSLSTFRWFIFVLSVTLNFYISGLQKYNTGTLYIPWGYDLCIWVASLMFLAAGVYGPQLFRVYLLPGYTFVKLFEISIHLTGLLATLPVTIYNVYLSYKNRTGKMYSLQVAIRPILSLLTVTFAVVYWAVHSPNNILEYDPRAFIFLYGTLFSYISTRLMIADMAQQMCDLINWFLWPLLAGIVLSILRPQLEVPIFYFLMTMAFLFHLHYGVCVVSRHKIDKGAIMTDVK